MVIMLSLTVYLLSILLTIWWSGMVKVVEPTFINLNFHMTKLPLWAKLKLVIEKVKMLRLMMHMVLELIV